MIVPGGRFRETYYWDSYWIVRGLLVCGMSRTARNVVDNLLDDVRKYGFVPNGGRIYYLDRSQPPMLSEMVLAVFEAQQDGMWLRDALAALEIEYHFWMSARSTRVHYKGVGALTEPLILNTYGSSSRKPRPESYREDVHTAELAHLKLGREMTDVYWGLRAGAETGWDFSSRWLGSAAGTNFDLATINAGAVVPVDLNCILYRMELNLARGNRLLARAQIAKEAASVNSDKYDRLAMRRLEAIHQVLWNEEEETFRDFRIDQGAHSQVVSISDYAAPLWAGIYGPQGLEDATRMLASLRRSRLLQAGGAETTNTRTGQQWDAPNAWPPMQLMLIEGLDRLASEDHSAKVMADHLASSSLQNMLFTWQKTGYMQEKYDAKHPGHRGGGGEYTPQIGFGWTNGVALVLLMRAHTPRAPILTG